MQSRVLTVCIALAGFLLIWAPASAQGVLVFDRTTHEFGAVADDSEVATTFRFENRGDRPLQVKAVRPSCGCTVPDFTDGIVAPGEGGVVEVVFNPAGRSGSVRQDVVVIVDTNAADLVTQPLVIRAEVVPAEQQE
jgi:hypothetical protein